MKIRSALCLLVLTLSSTAFAGPDSEKIAADLLDASGVKASLQEGFISSIRPGLEQMKKNGGDNALVNEMLEVAKKFYDDNFHWELARPQIAKAYAAELSDEDMTAILAFYQSPAGKVAATKLPLITHKGTDAAMTGFQTKMPDLQAAMIAVVKKHMDAGTLKGK
ncbi:MAG: hypothetical protein JWO94_3454 [Verrucomicrobiaceae bacterium]|nr:hypothetical protein [Verrucomicrobiaceae bacterium]